MNSAPVVWEPLPRSARPFLLKWVLPTCVLCVGAVAAALLAPHTALAVLVPTVLTLPFLLQAAESRWQRLQGRSIQVDRRGMRVGDVAVRWSDVLELEIGSNMIKFRVAWASGQRPRRSLIWSVGLYPGDGRFDFYLGPDYAVPLEEMARVIGAYAELA